MKTERRRLCAAAFAAICAPSTSAVAQGSSVTLYGTADAGLYSRELAGEGRISRVDSGLMTTSRWGVRGTEDLGGGLSAFFDLSSHVRLDTGEVGRHAGDTAAGRYWSRMSLVGLRGSLGQIRLGRIPTGTWVNALNMNAFGESAALGPLLLHTFIGSQPMLSIRGNSDGVWSNSLAYTTPVVSGISGSLQVAPSEGSTEGRRVDATVNYRSGDFAAALSYSRIADAAYRAPRRPTDPAGAPYTIERETAVLGSVSYDFKVLQLYANVVSARMHPIGLPAIDLKTGSLSAAMPIGAGRALVSWARTVREQDGLSDRKRSTVAVGYDYLLSKRTDLYGVVLFDRATGLTSGTSFAVGIRHHF